MAATKTWMVLISGFWIIAACTSSHEIKIIVDPRTPDDPVTAANYLSGQAFCSTYSNPRSDMKWKGTAAEYSKRVNVPKDYAHPEAGTFSLYAWTTAPFDSNKPTFIFIDGGPGGNSHGEDGLSDNRFNEIHFDQRGLGCSAPETFAEYQDPSYYSSANSVKDMDAIRNAYGISKWTPYGTSYGTVLATMYANQYPKRVSTVILDGTLLNVSTDTGNFTKDKLNYVLSQLNSAQQESLRQFMSNESPGKNAVLTVSDAIKFQTNGYSMLLDFFNKSFDSANRFSPAVFQGVLARINFSKNGWGRPQAPSNLDQNILIKVYCKDLDLTPQLQARPYYSTAVGRYQIIDLEAQSPGVSQKICNYFGVTSKPDRYYTAYDYPISRPVTYFQGTDDGATPISEALAHWRGVARGQKSFLLRKRGGHCPNALALMDEDLTVKSTQMELFARAVLGRTIDNGLMTSVNGPLPAEQQWRFYSDAVASNGQPEAEEEGI